MTPSATARRARGRGPGASPAPPSAAPAASASGSSTVIAEVCSVNRRAKAERPGDRGLGEDPLLGLGELVRAVAAQGGQVMAPALELGRREQLGGALVVELVPLEVEEQQRRLRSAPRAPGRSASAPRPRATGCRPRSRARRRRRRARPRRRSPRARASPRRCRRRRARRPCRGTRSAKASARSLGVVEPRGDTVGALAVDQRLEVPARLGERLVGGRRRGGGCLGMHAEEATQARRRGGLSPPRDARPFATEGCIRGPLHPDLSTSGGSGHRAAATPRRRARRPFPAG